MGEVSITKYSTDPRDLGSEGDVVRGSEVTSVTTTQKFGYKGTPSLKNITGGAKKVLAVTHLVFPRNHDDFSGNLRCGQLYDYKENDSKGFR